MVERERDFENYYLLGTYLQNLFRRFYKPFIAKTKFRTFNNILKKSVITHKLDVSDNCGYTNSLFPYFVDLQFVLYDKNQPLEKFNVQSANNIFLRLKNISF